MKPHKHAELIKAWADGAEIQVRAGNNCSWSDAGETPRWVDSLQYRIKPEPKPDVVNYLCNTYELGWNESTDYLTYPNEVIKIIRDGETGKLKDVEVLNWVPITEYVVKEG